MRAWQDSSLSDYLLWIGNGIEPLTEDGKIKLHTTMIIPHEENDASLNILIHFIFPNIINYAANLEQMINLVILTQKTTMLITLIIYLLSNFQENLWNIIVLMKQYI